MASTGKSVLIIGLKQSPPGGPYTAEVIRKTIDEQVAKIAAAGYDVKDHLIDLSLSSSELKQQIQQTLRSKHWDGVVIGFGVRGNIQLSVLFEDVVNDILAEVQPVPKMMFGTTPDSCFDDVKRVMEKA